MPPKRDIGGKGTITVIQGGVCTMENQISQDKEGEGGGGGRCQGSALPARGRRLLYDIRSGWIKTDCENSFVGTFSVRKSRLLHRWCERR